MIKKDKKVTLVLTESERLFLEEARNFHYAEGKPITLSALARGMMFNKQNPAYKELYYALGYEGI